MEVIATDEFIEWYNNIDMKMVEDVTVSVDLLEVKGVSLGHPYSSKIEGTDINLRELRIQSAGPCASLLLVRPGPERGGAARRRQDRGR